MSLIQSIRDNELNITQLKSDYIKRITPIESDTTGTRKNNSKHKFHRNPRQFDLDIQRYEELFDSRKLTYLEQETKERFLRAIINDPPFFVEQWDMKDVEETTRGKKIHLKEEKARSKQLLEELDKKAREIYSEYKFVNETNEQTKHLHNEIGDMELELQKLESQYTELQIPQHSDPELNTSVEELGILENEYLSKIQELDKELLRTNQFVDEALAMQFQLEKDIDKLKNHRDNIQKSAKEIVRIRTEDMNSRDKDMEITANFYRNMVECLLELSELKDFDVAIADCNEPDTSSTVLEVKFSLICSPSTKFTLYINDLTGQLLPQSTVSDAKSSIIEEALSYISKAPPSTQAQLFVKRIKQNTSN